MESFTAITFEIYFNSAWTDVSADVRANPHPRINGIGIMGNGFADRVGDAGTCEFSLDNSAANSAGTLGYYTPTSVTSPTKVVPGCPVRVSFTYDGYKRYKFYGTIDNDGVVVETGKYRGRSVKIRASNWFALAARTNLDLMDYQTGLRADQGIQNVIDKMYIKPQKWTLEKGTNTFPTVFDITRSTTAAAGEINKLTLSDLGFCFIRGGGETTGEELVYMTRSTFGGGRNPVTFPDKNSSFTDTILNETGGTDDILLETGDSLLLEHSLTGAFRLDSANDDFMTDMQVQYGKNMTNRFRFVTYPRSVDAAAAVLWSSESYITIAAGETLTEIRGNYTDPGAGNAQVGGINMVVPTATTDYQLWSNSDGTGVDRTADLVVSAQYGTAEVKYSLTNNNAATSYVTKLQARGTGVYVYDKQEKVFDDTTTQALYGVLEESIDMPYTDGATSLFDSTGKVTSTFFASGMGFGWQYPEMTIESISFVANTSALKMMAFMFIEPSDIITLKETLTNATLDASGAIFESTSQAVMGIDIEILPGKIVKYTYALRATDRV